MTSVRRTAPIALVLALAGIAATGTANLGLGMPASAPTASTHPSITLAGELMSPCITGHQSALCGQLSVPEDHSAPNGRHIDVRVAVIPALQPAPRPDPVFMLDGGPGQAATEDLDWTIPVFSALHADHDFVFVDQRGTGGSNRLVVPDPPDTTGLSDAERDAAIRTWLAQALAEMPGDPRFYTTSAAMDDLDDVRAALGYDAIDVYGPSYGATAAQYYLRQHSDHARAVILDGGTLLDVPIFERIAANSQRALDLLLGRCEADATCHAAFPDIRTEFGTVLSRLGGQPATTTVEHPWTGEPIVIDALTFSGLVHGALMDHRALGDLPSLIHAAFVGDWDRLGTVIASLAGPKDAAAAQPLVMSVVIRCSEAWARFDPAEVARLGATSYLRDAQVAAANDQLERCAYAPPGAVPANDADPVQSDVPVLVMLGDADPQNPPSNVADAPRQMPNSLTVIVPGQTHTVAEQGCMPSVVDAFFDAGSVGGLDTSCASSVPSPSFLTTP